MRSPHVHLHPPTSSQREIWFDQMLHEGVALYNIGGHVHLPGAIDAARFDAAVGLLLQRHDALRIVMLETVREDSRCCGSCTTQRPDQGSNCHECSRRTNRGR